MEGECTALQTAALPLPALEAGQELDAWGQGCPLAVLGLFPASVQGAEQPQLGRELAHPRNEGSFVVQLVDFGQVSGDRGFGQNCS